MQVVLHDVEEGAAPSAEAWATLDPAELARAEAFVRDADRYRFVRAHALLRVVLGRRLGIDPPDLVFGVTAHGKPAVESSPDTRPVGFNLSHTAGLIAIAIVDPGWRVGIDVECRRAIGSTSGMASRFSEGETTLVASAAEASRHDVFLRLWTRKEAVHKADGRGLSLPLDTFDVRGETCGEWRLADLDLSPRHIGAVAFEARDPTPVVETHRL